MPSTDKHNGGLQLQVPCDTTTTPSTTPTRMRPTPLMGTWADLGWEDFMPEDPKTKPTSTQDVTRTTTADVTTQLVEAPNKVEVSQTSHKRIVHTQDGGVRVQYNPYQFHATADENPYSPEWVGAVGMDPNSQQVAYDANFVYPTYPPYAPHHQSYWYYGEPQPQPQQVVEAPISRFALPPPPTEKTEQMLQDEGAPPEEYIRMAYRWFNKAVIAQSVHPKAPPCPSLESCGRTFEEWVAMMGIWWDANFNVKHTAKLIRLNRPHRGRQQRSTQ